MILASLHEVKEGCSFIKGSEEAPLFQTNLEIRDRSLMFATDNQNIQLMKESLQNFFRASRQNTQTHGNALKGDLRNMKLSSC